ncbi:glycosyltransferase [Aequorivita sp. Q41]|uniref:glycosyltransferase n=1 Tax=Aequorivita sp. Q41 TaxID=3153300 RepID=UPI00324223C2
MNRTTNGVSVILCCYNSAKRLPSTLAYLANQKIKEGLHWELILVNNNSSDGTSKIAVEVWKSLGSSITLRIIDEYQAGLSYARNSGVQAANYDILIWCDDDNWLCETYVQTAFEVMNENLNIGALGGWCEAIFESKKPDWFDTQARYFAVSRQGKQTGDITNKKGCVYGAGMVLRKSHWLLLKKRGFHHLLSDRVGKQLSSGGDTEYCYVLRIFELKMWFDERLYFQHFMSNERLHLEYVSRMRKAMAYSNFMLWPYLDILKEQPRNKIDLIRYAFKGGVVKFLKKSVALLIGDFEQREVAKRYFRQQSYCLFQYKVYKRNLETIKKWTP